MSCGYVRETAEGKGRRLPACREARAWGTREKALELSVESGCTPEAAVGGMAAGGPWAVGARLEAGSEPGEGPLVAARERAKASRRWSAGSFSG